MDKIHTHKKLVREYESIMTRINPVLQLELD